MNKVDHIKYGFIGTVIFAIIFQVAFGFQGIKHNLVLIPIIYIYTLLPDVDHKMSTITWNLLLSSHIIMLAGLIKEDISLVLLGYTISSITLFSALYFKHRGPSHSIVWVFGSPFLLLFIKDFITVTPFLLSCAGVAYWIHMICDNIPIKLTFKAWSTMQNNRWRII